MAEAIVNLKLAPADFDLLRDALEMYEVSMKVLVKNDQAAGVERERARRDMVRAQDLLGSFGR